MERDANSSVLLSRQGRNNELVNRQWKIWFQAHVCTVVAGAHVLLLTTVVVGAFLWGYNIISRKYRIKHDQTQCSPEQSSAGHENRITNCKSMEVTKAAAAALNQQTDHHPVVLIEPTAMGSPCLFDSAGDVSTYVQVKNTEAAHKFRMGSTPKTAQATQSSSTNVLKSLQESDQMLPCAIFTESSMTSGTDHEQDIELDLDYLEYERHVRAQMEFSAKGYKSVNCKLQQPAWRRSLCMFWQRSKLRSHGMTVFGIDQSCITTTPPPPDHVVASLRMVVDKLQRPAGNSSFPGKIKVPSNSSPLYNTTDFFALPTKNRPSSCRRPAFSEQIFGGKPSDRNDINGSPYVPLHRMQQQQQMASSPLYIV